MPAPSPHPPTPMIAPSPHPPTPMIHHYPQPIPSPYPPMYRQQQAYYYPGYPQQFVVYPQPSVFTQPAFTIPTIFQQSTVPSKPVEKKEEVKKSLKDLLKEIYAIKTSTKPCKYDETCWVTQCTFKHTTKSGLSAKAEKMLEESKRLNKQKTTQKQ
jgi:hypothetical protein